MSISTTPSHRAWLRAARYQSTADQAEPDPMGSGAGRVTPGSTTTVAPDIIGMGMKLFLASLTMIFGATFAAYGIFRWRNRLDWEGMSGSSEIPGLVGATVLLIVADIAASRALKRAPDRAVAKRLTLITLISASLYLAVQAVAWAPILRDADPNGTDPIRMERVLFFMLTVTHAIHVLGGIISNAIVLLRSKESGPKRDSLRMLYSYWRYLTVVWVIVLGILVFG